MEFSCNNLLEWPQRLIACLVFSCWTKPFLPSNNFTIIQNQFQTCNYFIIRSHEINSHSINFIFLIDLLFSISFQFFFSSCNFSLELFDYFSNSSFFKKRHLLHTKKNLKHFTEDTWNGLVTVSYHINIQQSIQQMTLTNKFLSNIDTRHSRQSLITPCFLMSFDQQHNSN